MDKKGAVSETRAVLASASETFHLTFPGRPRRGWREWLPRKMQCAPHSVTGNSGTNGHPDAGKQWAFPTLGGRGTLLASLARLLV